MLVVYRPIESSDPLIYELHFYEVETGKKALDRMYWIKSFSKMAENWFICQKFFHLHDCSGQRSFQK